MRYCKIILLCLVFCSGFFASAQNNPDFRARTDNAKKLFLSGTYYAAEQAFDELLKECADENSLQSIELKAYKLMCAINLDRVNAVGLEHVFEAQYPNAVELPMVKYTLASHLFDKEDYSSALAILSSVNRKLLFNDVKLDYDFKYAFCSMHSGKYRDAEKTFLKIIDVGNTPQYYPSIYYLAYVYYRDNRFENAYDWFMKAKIDSRFTLMASYFATESKFMLGDYDYVIDKGPDIYNDLEEDLQSTLARMISEAYFKKDLTADALRYFKLFAKDNELSGADNYFGGILHYNTLNYKEALEYFMKVAGSDDAMSQNAEYYAANASLKEYNKLAAMSLFKAASEKDFDKVIKEDALFNYAKLSFDVNSDISQLEYYLEQYPDSGRDDAVNGYMAASFLLKKDFASAIEALKKIKNLNGDDAENLQKAAFFRAMQLIDVNSYRSATPFLELSIEYDGNRSLYNLANYWLAECYYRNDRYDDASAILRPLISSTDFNKSDEYSTAVYNLAYCYFKKGDFKSAQQWFQKYLNISARQFDTDANVRLADSYFMQSDYGAAANAYEKIYRRNRSSDNAYSAYQAAISYGLLNNDSRKIDILRQVTRNNMSSPIYCQALYELGRTYVQKGNDDRASECFYTLIGRKSDSLYYSKALIELAMINANKGNNDAAIDFYKQIVEQTPYSEEVQDALSGMESIYMIQNEPDKFLEFLDEQNLAGIKAEDERENMMFSSAEHLYLSRNYTKAITSLRTFLSKFPDGTKTAQANFYLAESLKAIDKKEEAADEYLKVIKFGEGEFLCTALDNYARINYETGNYPLAADVYQNLISAATDDVMKIEGYRGKMRCYYANKQYNETISTIQMLGDVGELDHNSQREAEFLLAKSYMMLGERDQAVAVFEDLSKDCNDEYGAESSYTLIQNAYAAGDFASVENLIYAFVDKESPYVYWLAKSFIILGDTYYDRRDFEQAEATYNSVLEGYEPTGSADDVISQVEGRLKKLEERQ